MKKYQITILIGLFLALPGQFIWAFIFWNNDNMFMHHWTVALLGLLLCIIASPFLAKDIVNNLNN